MPRALALFVPRAKYHACCHVASQLSHPNILAIFDIGTFEGAPYIVSELVEGETLRRRLADGPLPLRAAVELAGQVAQRLAPAHWKGIVHRDLKPENLLITGDGRVKILDFGLVKLLQPAPPAGQPTEMPTTPMATEIGVVVGTIGYMAPEHARGLPCDHRTDIFAFGCVLYEMLAGERAFQGESPADTLIAILKEPPAERPLLQAQVPSGLARLVHRCLEKSPERRFQSAADLAFALEGWSGPSGSVMSAPASASGGWNRAALRYGLGVLLAAAFLGAGWLLGRARPEPRLPAIQQLTWRNGNVMAARFAPDGTTVVHGAAWAGRPRELFTTQASSRESRPLGIANAEVLGVSRQGELALSLGMRYSGELMPAAATLALADLGGGAPRPLLERVCQADWSPDGGALAVVRVQGGKHQLEYPVRTVLLESDEWLGYPRVSPDGERVALMQYPPDLIGNLGRVLCVDRSKRTRVLTPNCYRPRGLDGAPAVKLAEGLPNALPPDGRWVLLVDPGKKGHRLVPTGPGEPRVLRAPGLEVPWDAEWLPDSRGIVFIARAPGGAHRLHLQALGGSLPRATSVDVASDRFFLSPEGTRAVASSERGPPALVPISGGAAAPAPGLRPGDFVLAWRNEGLFVAQSLASIPTMVDLVDPATGERKPWRELGPTDRAGLATGDLTHVSILSRDTYAHTYLQVLSDFDLVSGLK